MIQDYDIEIEQFNESTDEYEYINVTLECDMICENDSFTHE